VRLPKRAIQTSDTIRLIPTAYYKPPVLRALVDDEGDVSLLAEIEALTNRRIKAQESGLAGLDKRELTFGVFGKTHINAAFAYTRAEGNRFNDSHRGAWYCTFDDVTAISEVGYHRSRELSRIGVFEDETIYQALLAGFVGEFHDIGSTASGSDFLGPDPETAYPAGQALAASLRAEGSFGIVYPSVRRAGGECLVAFHPHLVQNVRPGARWKLTWSGTAAFEATTT
jgi:hypothetical protein